MPRVPGLFKTPAVREYKPCAPVYSEFVEKAGAEICTQLSKQVESSIR